MKAHDNPAAMPTDAAAQFVALTAQPWTRQTYRRAVSLLQKRPVDKTVRNAAPDVTIGGTTATLRLFDPIDNYGQSWGLSAVELAAAIDRLPSNITEIKLLINSPGGDVFDGITIANVLRAHPARVVAIVQGLAASAASFIACSANTLIMAPESTMMIHDAGTVAIGNADDMRQMADLLDKLSNTIAGIYVAKAGRTVAYWREQMRAETWFTANEALKAKLADIVEGAPSATQPAHFRNQINQMRLALLDASLRRR